MVAVVQEVVVRWHRAKVIEKQYEKNEIDQCSLRTSPVTSAAVWSASLSRTKKDSLERPYAASSFVSLTTAVTIITITTAVRNASIAVVAAAVGVTANTALPLKR